jgi:hypothetical protein
LPSLTFSAAINTAGTGRPAAASRARINACDPDLTPAQPVGRQLLQEHVRPWKGSHTIEGSQLQLLEIPGGGWHLLSRKEHGDRVLGPPAVAHAQDLLNVELMRGCPGRPTGDDHSGRVHERSVDVDKQRLGVEQHRTRVQTPSMLSPSPSKITDLAIPARSHDLPDRAAPQNCETRVFTWSGLTVVAVGAQLADLADHAAGRRGRARA